VTVAFALKRVAHSPSVAPGPDPHWSVDATMAIRAAESRTEWARDVAFALESLPAAARSFVALSYFEGLGHAQIAARAGVPIATVSRAIAAGLQQIARAMQPA
jgi:DNA-directed RNA polymerase specialized sigma24 family protein